MTGNGFKSELDTDKVAVVTNAGFQVQNLTNGSRLFFPNIEYSNTSTAGVVLKIANAGDIAGSVQLLQGSWANDTSPVLLASCDLESSASATWSDFIELSCGDLPPSVHTNTAEADAPVSSIDLIFLFLSDNQEDANSELARFDSFTIG